MADHNRKPPDGNKDGAAKAADFVVWALRLGLVLLFKILRFLGVFSLRIANHIYAGIGDPRTQNLLLALCNWFTRIVTFVRDHVRKGE